MYPGNYVISHFVHVVLLLPKLRSHFAEFLYSNSLITLVYFHSSTCDGLLYDLFVLNSFLNLLLFSQITLFHTHVLSRTSHAFLSTIFHFELLHLFSPFSYWLGIDSLCCYLITQSRNLWIYGHTESLCVLHYSCQHSYSRSIFTVTSYQVQHSLRDTLLPWIITYSTGASVHILFSSIYGAVHLHQYVFTRLLSDCCFQAYCLCFIDFLLPFLLRCSLRPYLTVWAVSLLTNSTSLLLSDFTHTSWIIHSLSLISTLLHAISEIALYLSSFLVWALLK